MLWCFSQVELSLRSVLLSHQLLWLLNSESAPSVESHEKGKPKGKDGAKDKDKAAAKDKADGDRTGDGSVADPASVGTVASSAGLPLTLTSSDAAA